MSNTFNPYTPQEVGQIALGLVAGGTRLADLARRFGPDQYREGRGRYVYLTVPSALIARSRTLDDTTTAIVLDSINETQEPVELSTHAVSAVGLSEYDLSLGLQDFSTQVLLPQADAVADRLEATMEAALAAVPADESIAYSAADPVKTFTAARGALRARGIDPSTADLVAVVGAQVSDDLMDSGALDFGKTGSADALRDGALGRIRGFDAIESARVGESEVVFMTRDSLYVATRPPAVPQGASFGAIVTKDGLAVRYLRDYDAVHTQDRSIVSTFIGAGLLPYYRVERDYAAGTAEAVEVPGGTVVKVDTAA